ncbi:hypothetical protein [Ensifer adhaerens]|uniref:hypothetical protein n=1 Tax=Ensifer adhaerens TaxID=106592 RepID=UPI001178A147|nr:hypothetical protein [Ensifer adhaerens]
MPLFTKLEHELLQALLVADVDFVVVGGGAVVAHGHQRERGDIDILVRQTDENLRRLREVQLDWIGFKDHQIAELKQLGAKIQDKRRGFDLLTDFHGMDLEEIFATKVTVEVDGRPLPFMSRGLVIASKKAAVESGKHEQKDLDDIKALS